MKTQNNSKKNPAIQKEKIGSSFEVKEKTEPQEPQEPQEPSVKDAIIVINESS